VEPDEAEDKSSAKYSKGHVSIDSVLEVLRVKETGKDSRLHVFVAFISTFCQTIYCELKAQLNLVLLFSTVFDVLITSVPVLKRTSSYHQASQVTNFQVILCKPKVKKSGILFPFSLVVHGIKQDEVELSLSHLLQLVFVWQQV